MTIKELIKKYEGMLGSASVLMRCYYLELLKDLKALDEPKQELEEQATVACKEKQVTITVEKMIECLQKHDKQIEIEEASFNQLLAEVEKNKFSPLLAMSYEDFFWKRTTEFIKTNLKEIGELSKEIFEILPMSPERKATAIYGYSKGIGEVTKMEDIIKPSLEDLATDEEISPTMLLKRVEERMLNHKTRELVHNRMIERREAILLEVVEKFPPDLVDVYMSGYDIVTKILGADEEDW